MHSRAFLLLKRDLANLERLPVEGITASPVTDDYLYHWNARIDGLNGTVWEGGVFLLSLVFSEYYNTQPPSVHFVTIPYHPNVDPNNGVPSMSLLKHGWNEELSLTSLLLALQTLLSDPELDQGCVLNSEAAYCYKNTPHTYKQMVFDCVSASLRIEAGLTPYGTDVLSSLNSSPCKTPPTPSTSHQEKLKQISFDDYHVLWKGLATSVPKYNSHNHFIQLLERDQLLKKVHFKTEHHRHEDLQRRMQEHLSLKYGVSSQKPKQPVKGTDYKQKRIAELMALYTSRESTTTEDSLDEECGHDNAINELVAWTTTLDESELDITSSIDVNFCS